MFEYFKFRKYYGCRNFYQPNGGSNHLLSVRSIKIEKKRGACHIKLFKSSLTCPFHYLNV